MKRIRLDKLLADYGFGSRREVKSIIRTGSVSVNSEIVTDASIKIEPRTDRVMVNGQLLHYREYFYFMMNKPAGVISATSDIKETTVLDIMPDRYKVKGLFPVGRLDKDTEGLLLISNDGQLAHRLLSPRNLVPKTYYAEILGMVEPDDVQAFKKGILLDEDFTTLPSKLVILESGNISRVEITIYEGKYHQIKRMFEAIDKRVAYLKRISMGSLHLDPTLSAGEVRELTENEIAELKNLHINA
jgi:16S rRNA pseudouridine516 synthase